MQHLDARQQMLLAPPCSLVLSSLPSVLEPSKQRLWTAAASQTQPPAAVAMRHLVSWPSKLVIEPHQQVPVPATSSFVPSLPNLLGPQASSGQHSHSGAGCLANTVACMALPAPL